MNIENAKERMKDLIHTCDIGIEKYDSDYDDLFSKDKEAIEVILKRLNQLESYYQNEINLLDKYVKKDKIKNILEKYGHKELIDGNVIEFYQEIKKLIKEEKENE